MSPRSICNVRVAKGSTDQLELYSREQENSRQISILAELPLELRFCKALSAELLPSAHHAQEKFNTLVETRQKLPD